MKLKSFLKRNNRGSGIVTVLVAIVFLAAFGTMLAILSYTGMEMRASDRKGKKNLYDASAVMEQVNAGIQGVCSSAIENAYARTLIFYNDYGSNVTRLFRVRYRESIQNWTGAYYEGGNLVSPGDPGYNSNKGTLIAFDGDNYYYRLSVLKAMVVDDQQGEYIIDSVNKNGEDLGYVENFNTEITDEGKPAPITLKDVSITFTKEGRTTRITSDITIDYPSIGYSNNTYNETGLSQHACVTKGRLIQNAGQGASEIHGDAYFGAVDLSGAGSTMKFTGNGRFVTAGNVTVGGNETNRFTLDTNDGITDSSKYNTLWAQNIIVEKNSSAKLLGSTYVANDLALSKNSNVKLAGTYFGFGNNYDDPAASSSILMNGKGASLDTTGLQGLDLAGFAFIGDSGVIKSAESVSVKENQKAYMLPAEMVYYVYEGTRSDYLTNPEVMPVTKFQAIKNPDTAAYPTDGFRIEQDTSFWDNRGADYYGITSVAAVSESFPGSDNVNVYAFASFESLEKANEFFRDYFEYRPSEINNYINQYVSLTTMSGNARTASNYFFINSEGEIERGDSVSESDLEYLNMTAANNAEQYASLCTNLNLVDEEEGGEEEADNPLDFILSEDLNDLAGDDPYETYYDKNGAIVAIAANGDVTIVRANVGGVLKDIIKVKGTNGTEKTVQNADPDTVCLIVTTGNITVDGVDFNGLLVSDGDIELKRGSDLNKDPTPVTLAYEAKSSDGDTIGEYIDTQGTDVERDSSAWAVTELVGYNNWKRSSED